MRPSTMRGARTWSLANTRPPVGQSSGPAPLSLSRSCPGCTTIMSGYNFRKGQPGFPVLDNLGDGPAAPRNHRRSTSHGFDQHQTKRLGPIDREQESLGISKESGLFAVAYLPDEFNQRIGQ